MAQVPTTDVTTISVGGSAYTIPFLYQNQAEVFVEVDGVATAFTWINSGNINITPAPAAGAKVRRYRSTFATSLRHDFRNGVPFTPKNITENNDQLLYAVQEAVNDTAVTAALALATAEESLKRVQASFDILSERTQYIVLGPYGPGLNFQTTSQVFSYLGEFYAPGPSITLPYTTTGAGASEVSNFRSVGDAILRDDLLDPSQGAGIVTYRSGVTVEAALDNVEAALAKLNLPQFSATSVGGTANAITAVFNPVPTFPEGGRVLLVKSTTAASSPYPTFTPNAGVIGPRIIVKGGNLPLTVGDIPSGYTMLLSYDYAFDRYVLLNPATPTSNVVSSINGGEVNGNGNPIVNGAFDVWQFGNSFGGWLPHLVKLADRWNYDYNGTAGTIFVDRTDVASGSKFAGFAPKNSLRINCTAAPTGNTFQDLSTQIEGVDTYQDQVVTISFFATYLSGSPPLLTAIKTEQYFGSGGSPSPPAFTTSAPVQLQAGVGVWRRYSVTTTLASISGKTLGTNKDDTLNVIFTLPLNRLFDLSITCVQIEPGTVATPYQYRPKAKTLQECQRYLRTTYNEGVTPGTADSAGAVAFTAASTGTNLFTIQLPEPMRGNPAITFYNPATGATGTWNMSGTPVAVTVNTLGEKNITVAVAGCVAGAFIVGHYVIQDPML